MAKSNYTLRVLERVSREIGELYTFFTIQNILIDFGIPEILFEQRSAKWWIINESFKYFQKNSKDPDTEISKLIEEFLHPVNLNLPPEKISEISEKIGGILKYNKFHTVNTGEETSIMSENYHKALLSDIVESSKQEEIKITSYARELLEMHEKEIALFKSENNVKAILH